MFPFTDVYGIFAPFGSSPGTVATSRSYASRRSCGMDDSVAFGIGLSS
jgi:hypothetical protein